MSSSKEDKQVYGANLEGNGEKFFNGFQAFIPYQSSWWITRIPGLYGVQGGEKAIHSAHQGSGSMSGRGSMFIVM